jgi:hypothetical protein
VDANNVPPELICILDTGRRYQLDFYAICQAPNRIHNAVRNQITEVWTFRQSDKNAVAYLVDNSFNEDEIRNLQGHDCLWRNLSTGENNFRVPVARPDAPASANAGATGERPKLEGGGGVPGSVGVND